MTLTIPATSALTGAFGVPSTPAPSTTRTEQLQQLYLTNYQTIRQQVSDFGLNLYVSDIDNITAGIADHLDQAPDDPSEFLPWALSLASDAATQAEAFIAIRSDATNRDAVRQAIGSILKGCGELGVHETTLDEIEADLWMKVLEELPAWLTQGYANDPNRNPATLSTRLFAKAMWRARAWKTTRVREKARYAEADAVDLPSEACGHQVVCAVDY